MICRKVLKIADVPGLPGYLSHSVTILVVCFFCSFFKNWEHLFFVLYSKLNVLLSSIVYHKVLFSALIFRAYALV